MAAVNHFNVVNFSGGSLETVIDGKKKSLPQDSTQSPHHQFESGESITVQISGNVKELKLPAGDNSWSTLVYTRNNVINVFLSDNMLVLPKN